MVGLYLNFDGADTDRRQRLFSGEILLYSRTKAAAAFVLHAKQLIMEAFDPLDPEHAQEHLAVDEFVGKASALKTAFTNGAETKALIQNLLAEYGCDADATYFDVPRLRIVPHSNYLSAGVSYAYKAHRDTWYSSPHCQINWWMPVFDLAPERAMSFFPEYWKVSVPNSSSDFDYGEWCAVGRQQAVNQKQQDNRKHPLPLAPVSTTSDLRIAARSAELFMFSAAHLHSTAANSSDVTRFSIDFRTVCLADLLSRREAANVDSRAQGSTLNDFLNTSDFSKIPPQVIENYMSLQEER